MLAQSLYAVLPAAHGVAVFASRTKLATMYVGMAVRAARAHVPKYQLRVAQLAGHLHMHAA
jgi:hypothetical protein